MWPDSLNAAEQTVAAEAVIEAAYDAALRDWAPHALAAVVTAGQYGIEFEPNPDGVLAVQARWDEQVALRVLPEVAALWEQAVTDAVGGLGLDLEDPAAAFMHARDDYLDAYRENAARVPGAIREQLAALVAEQRAALTASLIGDLRAEVTSVLTAGSKWLREFAKRFGFHGSSILNDATVTVAKHAAGNRLASRKQWVAILDDRTRDTHWAADGQAQPLDGMFTVGGVEMAYPGDPRGPAREVINCRCRIGILSASEKGRHRKKPVRASVSEETDMSAPIVDITPAAPEGAEPTPELVAEEVPHGEEQPAGETYRTFTDAVLAFIGTPTSDYRLLAKDVELSFRTPPVALSWQRHSGEGHDNAATVGVIENISAQDDKVLASGYLLNTADADEAAEQLKHGVTRPSVKLGREKWHLTTEDGEEFTDEMWFNLPLTDQRGGHPYRTWTSAEILDATLVATPAFGDTYLRLDADRASRDSALVAAAAAAGVVPRVWPAEYFADPQLPGPTLPALSDDGRVYGHIACWEYPHRSVQTAQIHPPHSPSGYDHFHTSPAVALDDGTRVPVGRLTVGTGHADGELNGVPAQAHYDEAGACWALVRVGEDRHGIWFSGVPAPWATPEQIEAGLAAPLSGDWRDFGEGLDLIAALSVNTPGFRIAGRSDEYGRPVALVAALGPAPGTGRRDLSLDAIKRVVAEAMAEQLAAQRADSEREAAAAAAAQLIEEREAALAAAAELTAPLSPRDEIKLILAQVGF